MSNGTNPELQIALKANADQLLAAIKLSTSKIEELGSKIKSLPSGDKEFNKLSRELARTSVAQENLIKSFNKLGTETETTTPKLEKIGNASKSARTALSSLSLTLQDLPFGFIGVQNNLPAVIQSFGNLSTTTKGELLPALKAIGQSLLGPAGIFLAFSAVTSGVTYLIKEYGSLGAGIDALLGRTYSWTKALNDAQKAQKEFADESRTINTIQNDASASYEASALKLQTLTEIVLDSNKSNKDRKNALEQLKELDKDRFENFNIEKNALQGLQAATDSYTESLIANAVAKEYESEIGKTTKNYLTQLDALFLLQKEFDNLNSSYPDLADKATQFNLKLLETSTRLISAGVNADAVQKILSALSNRADPLVRKFNKLNFELKNQGDLINKNLFPGLEKLKSDYKNILNQITGAFVPKTGKSDKSAEKQADRQNKENLKGLIEYLKERQKLNEIAGKVELDSYLITLDERNQEIYKAGQKLNEDLVNLEKAGFKDSTSAREAYRIKVAEINAKYDKEEARIKEKIIKDAGEAELDAYLATLSDRDAELFKREIKFYQDLAAVKKAGTTDFTLIEEGYRADVLKINQKYDEKELKDFESKQNKLKKQFEGIRNNLQTIFFQPLSDIFEKFLEDGTFTFEEFRKVVINNIKKMVAQLAATQIISTLSSLLTGFTPAGTGSFLGNLISGNLGSMANTNLNAPNLSSLSNGGLSLSGGVSLVLRGSDLVGSINRTNAQISRVG